jgi:hypothetical protein
MQLQQTENKIPTADIINSIKYMGFDDVEKIKNSLIERDIYFKTHQKDDVGNIIEDFKENNYSDGFLKDLEQGLGKSSVYDN